MAIESCKIREKYQWPKFYQKQFNFSYFQRLKSQDLNCFYVSRVELSCNLFDAPIMYSCPAKTEGQNDLQSLHVSYQFSDEHTFVYVAWEHLWSYKPIKIIHGHIERSIFQTFWKPDFGARFLFIELDTSNFGYLLIF